MRRGSKFDMLGRVKAYCDVVHDSPKRVLVASRTHGHAVHNMREFIKIARSRHIRINNARMEVMYNGNTVRFVSVSDPQDVQRFQGHELSYVEHDGISEELFKQLIPLVRG